MIVALDRFFGISTARSDVRTEVLAGITTFLTMAYIAFVNPETLANAGMPKGAVITMLFFSPLIAVVPPHATAPVLVLVAVLMLRSVVKIAFDDPTEAVPAEIACITIPLTFSISNGLALAFLAFPVVKVAAGRAREVHPMMAILGMLFLLKFLFLSE